MENDKNGERLLIEPLIAFLRNRRRVRHDTLVAEELPWYGRRIDVATLSATRTTAAFELKLRDNRRAIEQAAYNKLSFDRSYVVTAARPSQRNVELASQVAVGLIVVDPLTGAVEVVLESPLQPIHVAARRRLLKTLRKHGEELAYV